MTKIEEYRNARLRQEVLEHQDTLLAIRAIIKTPEGKQLFSYLFKSFEVGNLPDRSVEGTELHEHLGFLRAGNSVYKISCEADFETTAIITAKIEKERYEDLRHQFKLESEPDANTSVSN